MFCTVFTPAYNRLSTLKRLYESLCNQTDKDFEWVVVDDGSEDGTEEWFSSLNDYSISVVYKKVINGGKHRAINKGLDIANGQVFAIVDSDDYLVDTAIASLRKMFATIANSDKQFCGVAGLKIHENGSIVGTTFDHSYIDAKSTERELYNIAGDKFEVFYTDILKNNKFPEIEGEKFLTEATVWYRLSRKGYLIRWFNEPIYVCEYLEGGLTSNQNTLYKNNPKGYALYIKERISFDRLSFSNRMMYICNYYDVRKEHASIKTIAREIDQAVLSIIIARGTRCIYRLIKRK